MIRHHFARTALAVALAAAAGSASAFDFGLHVEQLDAHSMQLFGIVEPLIDSAPTTTGAYRTAAQAASARRCCSPRGSRSST